MEKQEKEWNRRIEVWTICFDEGYVMKSRCGRVKTRAIQFHTSGWKEGRGKHRWNVGNCTNGILLWPPWVLDRQTVKHLLALVPTFAR